MQCPVHDKPLVGNCQWCGKLLCKLDVAKAVGKKVFCKDCSKDLSDHIQNKQIQLLKQENEHNIREKEYENFFEKY